MASSLFCRFIGPSVPFLFLFSFDQLFHRVESKHQLMLRCIDFLLLFLFGFREGERMTSSFFVEVCQVNYFEQSFCCHCCCKHSSVVSAVSAIILILLL